uniref:Ig-like domain-containing protein n=1 Tax=Maylandia zebra TaxID=106582 RepID=A0A3P9B817_9CICH
MSICLSLKHRLLHDPNYCLILPINTSQFHISNSCYSPCSSNSSGPNTADCAGSNVLQVTWQKISRDVETNVATYSKYYGQRVNDGFNDKVKNVTEQDEGCYHCLFNTYPEGSFTGRTCFQVYEWVVSCSATGRPAPTVTLSQQDLSFSQYNTVSVSNTNATFTVTTTAVLSVLVMMVLSVLLLCSRLLFKEKDQITFIFHFLSFFLHQNLSNNICITFSTCDLVINSLLHDSISLCLVLNFMFPI